MLISLEIYIEMFIYNIFHKIHQKYECIGYLPKL